MNRKPRTIVNLVFRLGLVLSALFSGINVLLPMFGISRMMPVALTMPRYLAKHGILKAEVAGSSFFSIYCASAAVVLCVVFGLCVLLGGKKRGFLAASAVLFLIDCAAIAVLIAANGYSSGYWFELVGHAVILVLFIAVFIFAPRSTKNSEEIVNR